MTLAQRVVIAKDLFMARRAVRRTPWVRQTHVALKEARKLVERWDCWHGGCWAVDVNDKPCSPWCDSVAAVSTMGAIMAIGAGVGSVVGDAERELCEADRILPVGSCPADANEEACTEAAHQRVLEVIDLAIERSEPYEY